MPCKTPLTALAVRNPPQYAERPQAWQTQYGQQVDPFIYGWSSRPISPFCLQRGEHFVELLAALLDQRDVTVEVQSKLFELLCGQVPDLDDDGEVVPMTNEGR